MANDKLSTQRVDYFRFISLLFLRNGSSRRQQEGEGSEKEFFDMHLD